MADKALGVVTTPAVRRAVSGVMQGLHRSGLPYTEDFAALAEVYGEMADAETRRAFLHVLRGVIDMHGQVVSMIDRAYLAQDMPTMIVWGERDIVIPVKHAWAAAQLLPGSRLEVLPHVGHVPHEDAPLRFADVVADFVHTTQPSEYDPSRWRRRLLDGPPPRRTVVRASA
jgi:pimeloyl-ACP methyl ester carboxylesterase